MRGFPAKAWLVVSLPIVSTNSVFSFTRFVPLARRRTLAEIGPERGDLMREVIRGPRPIRTHPNKGSLSGKAGPPKSSSASAVS